MFRHPKYYKELRKRNKEAVAKSGISSHASLESDQAISPTRATAPSRRATGPGPKLTRRERGIYKSTALTPGDKQQAIDETVPHCDIEEASSFKLTDPQATSDKHQAPRHKRQA